MKALNTANFSIIFMFAAAAGDVSAQTPPSAWALSGFDLGYTSNPGGSAVFGSSQLDTGSLTLNPDGTLLTAEGAGRWFFSDDFLYLAQDGVERVAITRELDTAVFAEAEQTSLGGGIVYNEVLINAAVALPVANFTRSEVAGTWQLLRQTSISFSDTFFGTTGYNGVFHARETLVLNEDGTFTITIISNTDPGDEDVGIPFNGTWSVVGRAIRLSIGGETLDLVNLSAGLDTYINFETETNTQGSNTNFNRQLDFAVREPGTLAAAELVGRWGLTGMTIDVEDDLTDTYLQELRGATFETGDATLFADGTGVYRRTRTIEPGAPQIENFTWQVVGKKLVVTDEEGLEFDFQVSAGKDFAVALNIEDGPGGDTDAYDLFTICRLPDAPGFAGETPGFDFSGTPRLSFTTTEGLFYQLQRSIDLREWINVGDPVEGDGTEKFVEDPAAPQPAAYYRLTIVADPTD